MTLMFCRIALRNIRRNPRRTFLTVAAIAFSLFCLIVFQALKEGLHREMVSSTIQLDAGSLQIHAAGYKINQASPMPVPGVNTITDVLKSFHVRNYSPRLKMHALILGNGNSSSVLLSGVLPESEASITVISSKIIQGSYLSDDKSILVSKTLAEGLHKDMGDEIVLMVRGVNGSPVIKKFLIEGIYSTALSSFDMSHVYVTRTAAGSLLGAAGVVSEIAVRTNVSNVDTLASELKQSLSPSMYQVNSWSELAPDVEQLIELNDATMGLLIIIVFAIVAMGIANTMTTIIFERFREFGTMAAIGTRPSGIMSMIVLESFFVGLLASAAGSICAVIACYYLARYGIDLTPLTSANQYFASSHVLRAHLTFNNIFISTLITLITAIIAGIYPAWKAVRLDPVKAILHT